LSKDTACVSFSRQLAMLAWDTRSTERCVQSAVGFSCVTSFIRVPAPTSPSDLSACGYPQAGADRPLREYAFAFPGCR